MPCLRDIGSFACVLTAAVTSTVHGGEITSLEYSSVNTVVSYVGGGAWANDSPEDFDASGMDFTRTYDGNVGDVTWNYRAEHVAGVDRFQASASTVDGMWVPKGGGNNEYDFVMQFGTTIDENLDSAVIRYVDYSFNVSGFDAPLVRLFVNGQYSNLELNEEMSVSGGEEVLILFAWDESFFPDEEMQAGLAMSGTVEILGSNAVVPGPFSLAILGFGGLMRRRRNRG